MRKIVVVAAVVVVGCFAVQPASATSSHDAVEQLLDKRINAVRQHDETAFMQTVDPQAPDAFKQEQRNRFAGLMSIPVNNYELQTTEANFGDLAPGLDIAKKHHAEAGYLPETRETFKLGDYDAQPMRNSFWYSYVERDGRWYFSALDETKTIGLTSTPNIWDNGAVATTSTSHFLVTTAVDQASRGKSLGDLAEKAMSQFQQAWTALLSTQGPVPWSAKIPLIVPSSPEQAATLLGTSNDVAKFAAFTSYTPIRDSGWDPSPPRLFAEDENLSAADETSQIGTLVHELTHAATASITGPNTPVWLQEGLAEWIRLGKPASVALKPGATHVLPSSQDFNSADATQLSYAYNEATAAVAFLASHKGTDAPINLFQETGKSRVAIGSPSYNLDQAMKTTTGWTANEFVAAWSVG